MIENMAREDLNPVEEARACAALIEELSLTREDVGRRVGRSRVAVSNLVRLLDLPDEALSSCEQRRLTEGHGRALLLAAENADRRSLARRAAAEGWSVRELEQQARSLANAERDGGTARRRTRSAIDPDRQEAISQIGDAVGAALGVDVAVTPAGAGYRVQIAFRTLGDALAFAERHTGAGSA